MIGRQGRHVSRERRLASKLLGKLGILTTMIPRVIFILENNTAEPPAGYMWCANDPETISWVWATPAAASGPS
jgi:hypothetical protein